MTNTTPNDGGPTTTELLKLVRRQVADQRAFLHDVSLMADRLEQAETAIQSVVTPAQLDEAIGRLPAPFRHWLGGMAEHPDIHEGLRLLQEGDNPDHHTPENPHA